MVLSSGLLAVVFTSFFALNLAIPTQVMKPPIKPSVNHRRLAERRRQAAEPNKAAIVPRQAVGGGWINMAYFGNWDIYDRGFFPSDIPVDRLTHLLYSFANINADGTVVLSDTYADATKLYSGDDSTESGNNLYGNFKQILALKQANRHLKVSLSIGGWTYASSFAPMNDASYRANFVKTAVQMVEDLGLDGLDVDYEYPTTDTIENYYNLLAALRTGLDALSAETNTAPFLLSIAVPAGPANWAAYGPYVAKIDKVIDFWNVMTYDFCGPSWQPVTCDVANLYGGQFNVLSAINWYKGQGASQSKLVVGEPLYGYAYSNTKGMNATYSGSPAGDHGEAGNYDYKDLPLSTSAVLTEDPVNVASYSYDHSTSILVSYDTPAIATQKAQWLMSQNLAGAMFWEVAGDKSADEDSLIHQFYQAFQAKGGLESSCNHVSFPKSSYDNVKNNLGSKVTSCDGSGGSTGSDGGSGSSVTSSGSATTTTTTAGTTTTTTTTSSVAFTSTSATTSTTTTSTVTIPSTTPSRGSAGSSDSIQSVTTSTTTTTQVLSTTAAPPVATPSGGASSGSSFVPCSSTASQSSTCSSVSIWNQTTSYDKGRKVQCNSNLYEAKWDGVSGQWDDADSVRPIPSAQYGAWSLVSAC